MHKKLNYEKLRFRPSLLIYYKLMHDDVTGCAVAATMCLRPMGLQFKQILYNIFI